jgi:hypothetical protein
MIFKKLFVFLFSCMVIFHGALGMNENDSKFPGKGHSLKLTENNKPTKRSEIVEIIRKRHDLLKCKSSQLDKHDLLKCKSSQLDKQEAYKFTEEIRKNAFETIKKIKLNMQKQQLEKEGKTASLVWKIHQFQYNFTRLTPASPEIDNLRAQYNELRQKYPAQYSKKEYSAFSGNQIDTDTEIITALESKVPDLIRNCEWDRHFERKLYSLGISRDSEDHLTATPEEMELLKKQWEQKKETLKLQQRLGALGKHPIVDFLHENITKETLLNVAKTAVETFFVTKIVDICNAIYHWNRNGVTPAAIKPFIKFFTDNSLESISDAKTYVECLENAASKQEYEEYRTKLIIAIDNIKRADSPVVLQCLQYIQNNRIIQGDRAVEQFIADKYRKLAEKNIIVSSTPLPSTFIEIEKQIQQKKIDYLAQKEAAAKKQQELEAQKLKTQPQPPAQQTPPAPTLTTEVKQSDNKSHDSKK